MLICEVCGTRDKLVRHHISYQPEIIQILCRRCHRVIHGKTHPLRPKDMPVVIQVSRRIWDYLQTHRRPSESLNEVLEESLFGQKEAEP